MLQMSLGVFTVVAAMGVFMLLEMLKGRKTEKTYVITHAGLAAFGAGLVITEALAGDVRLWANIGLAVVIIVLGGLTSLKRSKGGVPKGIAFAHGGLAVACYLLLVYNTATPPNFG